MSSEIVPQQYGVTPNQAIRDLMALALHGEPSTDDAYPLFDVFAPEAEPTPLALPAPRNADDEAA